ncbi:MAG: hypothetical protein HC892_09900 [Saprospiraceae bacterium]|nr:hypothetical protein [Saprospiraceae bacterium]
MLTSFGNSLVQDFNLLEFLAFVKNHPYLCKDGCPFWAHTKHSRQAALNGQPAAMQTVLGNKSIKNNMKKVFLLTVGFLLWTVHAHTQTVTIGELIAKTKCKDFACYNSFIMSKKFTFDKTTKGEDGTFFMFSTVDFVDDGIEHILTKNNSTFCLLLSGGTITSINTSSASYFSALSNQITELSFEPAATETPDDTTVRTTYYSKKHPKVSILVSIVKITKSGVGT